MDEKNLLLNISLGPPTRFDEIWNEIIYDKKLRKFLVESILGHFQSGNYEFRRMVWTNTEKYSKIFQKDCRET